MGHQRLAPRLAAHWNAVYLDAGLFADGVAEKSPEESNVLA